MLGTESLRENERCPGAEARLNALFTDPALSARVYGLVGSTNELLKPLARDGAPEGTLLVADRQTAGKGTRGRSFYSPKASGLYLSLLLRPRLTLAEVTLITPLAAVAVAEALSGFGIADARIKWVNDIYLHGRKVCGILAENQLGPVGEDALPTVSSVVLGIGINLVPPEGGFPEEIRAVAGTVFPDALPTPDAAERMAAAIANRFMARYRTLPNTAFLAEYRARSLLTGHDVLLMRPEGPVRVHATGIDDHAGLIVRHPDGHTETITCGDVSVRPADPVH